MGSIAPKPGTVLRRLVSDTTESDYTAPCCNGLCRGHCPPGYGFACFTDRFALSIGRSFVPVIDVISPPGADSGATQLLFIGSRFAFPDFVLRGLGGEFAGLVVSRMEDFAEEQDHDLPRLRLVVIEDSHAGILGQGHASPRDRFGGAPVALAYRDARQARDMFEQQQLAGRFDGLMFVPLKAPVAGFVSMLQIVLTGECVVPAELVRTVQQARPEAAGNSPPRPDPAVKAALTQRELEVLGLVSEGRRNKTIACELGVSEHTVKLHVHHIISKIGVDNRTQAAQWYHANRPQGGR